MKIECDKCSAKYSIADEKVRGKTFKIRCKKCSNVIIVRDKGAIAADSGAAAAADQAAPGWHLAINGETVGPMPEDEVRQRYSSGEIDRDTAVWQEGFDDWLPLGDVDAFADLPERSGDDPFAVSANQDDYAAGAGAAAGFGAAAAVAATGTDGPSEPHSPRVSKLTGQRNENSVLFSLDSLQAMATSGAATGGGMASPAARAQANPSKGLATSAPSSEGSGLIDIRSLGSMVGGGAAMAASAAPHAAADDAALPSFGGGGFGGLAATPLITPQAPVVEAAPLPVVQQRSNAPLYIMMIVLILAVGGLGAFIVLKKPPEAQTIVQEVPVVAPRVADEDDEKKDDDKDDEKKDDEKAAADTGGSDGGSSGSGGDEPEDDGKTTKSSGSKKSSGSSSKKSSGGSSSSTAGSSGSSTTKPDTKASSGSDSPSVDCILDPSKCGKPKKTSGGSSSSGSSGGSTKPGVPAKLSSTEIKKSMAAVKGPAKTCGSKHGAKPGEKVTVKISVSGSSGKVTKVTPMSPHNGGALGNCVAAALKSASFSEFSEATMGFQYSVTM